MHVVGSVRSDEQTDMMSLEIAFNSQLSDAHKKHCCANWTKCMHDYISKKHASKD
jgi:hypothetical protein